ncbi:phosphoglucomutase/phosphomannomutase PgmG [Elstera cyanobacteriorum]|uniref:phosphoglucomutase/phosphomannomutase PgmG n=1 Tax=Elstera cyanobacteriorum TaxID=2022747 RepID=UPI00235275D9|nr:phosphomannomutase/phosphoglucomutase [Elstera cyanobacteriorum]MCK6443678.1 phosphomannomutase/phosphoglucomutase [Elstera cyanobacteriorum]
MSAYRFEPTILREYDIRGIVGKTLSGADAQALGQAFATYVIDQSGVSAPRIAVGYDGRLSSPDMEAALVDGITSTGAQVVRVGLGPTPMLYYAAASEKLEAGIMITGSHNPPDYNGFKMMLMGGPVYGKMIQDIGQIAAEGRFKKGVGSSVSLDLMDRYVSRLIEDFKGAPLTVVWDAGNGAAGIAMEKLTRRLPGRHILLNEVIDGTFPAHHPDPTEEKNLVQLKVAVAEHRADLGIAFDGDGDRIGLIDGQGRVLWGDQILALLARPVLEALPGATIIADVKASQVLFDEVARLGGTPMMWATGHSLIKKQMKVTGAPLAGEMSGHIFFADRYFGFDDALYAAVRVLETVAWARKPLATLRDELPTRVNTPELRFPCADTRKFAVVTEVKERLTQAGANVSTVDGVRVNTADGWWLLRASNTQDVLVARCEAADAAGLERLKAELLAALAPSGVTPPQF